MRRSDPRRLAAPEVCTRVGWWKAGGGASTITGGCTSRRLTMLKQVAALCNTGFAALQQVSTVNDPDTTASELDQERWRLGARSPPLVGCTLIVVPRSGLEYSAPVASAPNP